MNMPADNILFAVLAVVLIVAAIHDLRFQKIPNLLTFPTMLMALVFHSIQSGWGGLWFSLTGLALGMGLMLIPYSMGVMGAGDAKLLGAAGAALGAKAVVVAILWTSIAGAFYAILLFLVNYRWSKEFLARAFTILRLSFYARQLVRISPEERETQFKKPKLSYGIAIASGVLLTMCWQVWYQRLPIPMAM